MILKFAETSLISRPAANKTVSVRIGKREWQKVPKRYWNKPKNQIWASWLSLYPTIKISESVFYKILRKDCKHIKVCRKATDLCTICKEYKTDKRRLAQWLYQKHSSCPKKENSWAKECIDGLCEKENNLSSIEKDFISQVRLNIQNAEEHKQYDEHQKQQFRIQKNELQQGEAIVVIDFKENLHLNIEAEETSYNYYDKPQRAYFSLSLYYKNNSNDLVNKFFDILSKNLTKDTYWVQCALDSIFQSEEWQQFNFSKVFLWMDNGPAHFRTYEFQHYLWNINVSKCFAFTCQWNYFVEGHGKSICDTHFSKISQALKTKGKEQEIVIAGSDDAVKAIKEMFAFWKEQTIQKNKSVKKQSFYDLSLQILEIPSSTHVLQKKLNFKNLKLYFHFEVDDKQRLGVSLLTGSSSIVWQSVLTSEQQRKNKQQKIGFNTPENISRKRKRNEIQARKRRELNQQQHKKQKTDKGKEKQIQTELEKEKEQEKETEKEKESNNKKRKRNNKQKKQNKKRKTITKKKRSAEKEKTSKINKKRKTSILSSDDLFLLGLELEIDNSVSLLDEHSDVEVQPTHTFSSPQQFVAHQNQQWLLSQIKSFKTEHSSVFTQSNDSELLEFNESSQVTDNEFIASESSPPPTSTLWGMIASITPFRLLAKTRNLIWE